MKINMIWQIGSFFPFNLSLFSQHDEQANTNYIIYNYGGIAGLGGAVCGKFICSVIYVKQSLNNVELIGFTTPLSFPLFLIPPQLSKQLYPCDLLMNPPWPDLLFSHWTHLFFLWQRRTHMKWQQTAAKAHFSCSLPHKSHPHVIFMKFKRVVPCRLIQKYRYPQTNSLCSKFDSQIKLFILLLLMSFEGMYSILSRLFVLAALCALWTHFVLGLCFLPSYYIFLKVIRVTWVLYSYFNYWQQYRTSPLLDGIHHSRHRSGVWSKGSRKTQRILPGEFLVF